MIKIKPCIQVEDEAVYKVFQKGYSDYTYKLDMDIKAFVARFLENEASREYSYIAIDNDKPIGLILGGIQTYQGIKTMRCGGFAVVPSYRNKGIGRKLFDAHLHLARTHNCKQLYLEVLKNNKKAIKFYKKVGYVPVHDYRLYKFENTDLVKKIVLDINEVSFNTIKEIRETIPELHLFWQGEMFTLEHFDNIKNYVISEAGKIVAALSLKNSGQINFIWVTPNKRQSGYARELLRYALSELNHNNLFTVAGNNFLYEGFLMNLDFKLEIEQFEMMRSVKEIG